MEKITNEQRREAEKRLKGLTWVGNKEDMIRTIVKNMSEEIKYGK